MSLKLKLELITEIKKLAKMKGCGKLKDWYAQIESSSSYICSEGTAKRFLSGEPIHSDIFRALCEDLGIKWQNCSSSRAEFNQDTETLPEASPLIDQYPGSHPDLSHLCRAQQYVQARYKTVIGQTASAIHDFESLIPTVKTKIERAHLIGQITNVSFISLSVDSIRDYAYLSSKHEAVDLALSDLNIPSAKCGYRSFLNPEVQKKLFSGDVFTQLYLLLFSAIFATETCVEPNAQRELLRLQLEIIRSLLKLSPKIAWNRFSPLIAQAIRKGDIDFAFQVWKSSHEFYSKNWLLPAHQEASDYVHLLEETNDIEWRIHKYLYICILLHQGDYDAALSAAEDNTISLPLHAEQYFVEASYLALDFIRSIGSRSIDCFRRKSYHNLRSHNSYLNLF